MSDVQLLAPCDDLDIEFERLYRELVGSDPGDVEGEYNAIVAAAEVEELEGLTEMEIVSLVDINEEELKELLGVYEENQRIGVRGLVAHLEGRLQQGRCDVSDKITDNVGGASDKCESPSEEIKELNDDSDESATSDDECDSVIEVKLTGISRNKVDSLSSDEEEQIKENKTDSNKEEELSTLPEEKSLIERGKEEEELSALPEERLLIQKAKEEEELSALPEERLLIQKGKEEEELRTQLEERSLIKRGKEEEEFSVLPEERLLIQRGKEEEELSTQPEERIVINNEEAKMSIVDISYPKADLTPREEGKISNTEHNDILKENPNISLMKASSTDSELNKERTDKDFVRSLSLGVVDGDKALKEENDGCKEPVPNSKEKKYLTADLKEQFNGHLEIPTVAGKENCVVNVEREHSAEAEDKLPTTLVEEERKLVPAAAGKEKRIVEEIKEFPLEKNFLCAFEEEKIIPAMRETDFLRKEAKTPVPVLIAGLNSENVNDKVNTVDPLIGREEVRVSNLGDDTVSGETLRTNQHPEVPTTELLVLAIDNTPQLNYFALDNPQSLNKQDDICERENACETARDAGLVDSNSRQETEAEDNFDVKSLIRNFERGEATPRLANWCGTTPPPQGQEGSQVRRVSVRDIVGNIENVVTKEDEALTERKKRILRRPTLRRKVSDTKIVVAEKIMSGPRLRKSQSVTGLPLIEMKTAIPASPPLRSSLERCEGVEVELAGVLRKMSAGLNTGLSYTPVYNVKYAVEAEVNEWASATPNNTPVTEHHFWADSVHNLTPHVVHEPSNNHDVAAVQHNMEHVVETSLKLERLQQAVEQEDDRSWRPQVKEEAVVEVAATVDSIQDDSVRIVNLTEKLRELSAKPDFYRISDYLDQLSDDSDKNDIKDISDYLEITHPGPGNNTSVANPKSPVTVNFDLEIANKLKPNMDQTETQQIYLEEKNEGFVLPEIVDPTKKITKAKSKKSKTRSKIPQRQNSTEKTKSEVDVEWDFEEQKNSAARQSVDTEEDRLVEFEAANGKLKSKDLLDSDSDSDSRDSAIKRPQLNSPGKRTIASSSGSDVALHEGAELSPDDNTDLVGSDGLRHSMQNILDQFMNEERRFDNQ